MKKLILIDGNAIMHRAYHAMPNFTTSTGQPVGSIYGFVSMLLRAIADLKPTHIIVTFDRPTPNFRTQLYTEYQAHRPKMDGDLATQVAGIHTVVESLDIPIFEVDGYEADDVIGTLATQAVTPDQNTEVILITGDRDLLQLVNANVKLYAPIKGLTEAKLYDTQAVVEKYGITPSQFIDLKALMGDASDNYAGVPGIGPKTASVLLQKYKTLEGIYEHIADLPQKQQQCLANGAESAALAKKLATIETNVPIHLDWDKCKFEIPDTQKVVDVLHSFQFKTLTNRFLEIMGEKPFEKQQSSLQILEKKEKKKPDQLSLV